MTERALPTLGHTISDGWSDPRGRCVAIRGPILCCPRQPASASMHDRYAYAGEEPGHIHSQTLLAVRRCTAWQVASRRPRSAPSSVGSTYWRKSGMEQRVSLVTLGVRDIARSRRFYEALGWTTPAKPDDDVV